MSQAPTQSIQPLASHFVSSPWRSSGKTLITLGLARACCDLGVGVRTFKKGPDYIDPRWLEFASQHVCYNLDLNVQSEQELIHTYRQGCRSDAVSLVEGTMGLHDGIARDGSDSNAAIARLLGIPVLLVLDCRKMNRTAAALLKGLELFDPIPNFSGIILNRLKSARHATKIRRAIEAHTGFAVRGEVAENSALGLAERELGLTPVCDTANAEQLVSAAGNIMQECCDLQALLTIDSVCTDRSVRLKTASVLKKNQAHSGSVASFEVCVKETQQPAEIVGDRTAARLKIGVARDAAFHFYYADDLEHFELSGAQLIELSPLQDDLPEDLDGLLLGGGFPERHAASLQENRQFREKLALAIDQGLVVHAECGGLMYLCRSIQCDSKSWDMVGAIDADVSLHKHPIGRGYMRLEAKQCAQALTACDLPGNSGPHLDPQLLQVAAHEFHHSSISFDVQPECLYRVTRGHGIDGDQDGILFKNVFASYAHFRHTAASPWISAFLARVTESQEMRA